MAIKADFTLRLRSKDVIIKEVTAPIAVEYIKAAQEVVAHASKNHAATGARYKDRSVAGNTARIGWAFSAPGKASFGSLTTNAAGTTDTRGKGGGAGTPKKDALVIIVASSSGYGGWLEVGHHKPDGTLVGPFPYIRPAWEIEEPKLLRRLKGVIK